MKKDTRLGGWWKRHLFTIQTLIICAVLALIVSADGILINIVMSSTQMLQSLIQAEATILGFFGIIAAYMLTSYDTRLDRLEKQRFDLEMKGIVNYPKAIELEKRIEWIKHQKRRTALGMCGLSGFLVMSLVFSIVTLGTANIHSRIVQDIGLTGLDLFFAGIAMIILLFYQMSWEAEET